MAHEVVIDGITYISSKRASELSAYTQDYVGQLARSGDIDARRLGTLWYIGKDSLLAHKHEKDSLLAAVQSDALGIRQAMEQMKHQNQSKDTEKANLGIYTQEHTKNLIPVIPGKGIQKNDNPIPIHVVRSIPRISHHLHQQGGNSSRPVFRWFLPAGLLTILLLVSFEFTNLRSQSVYASNLHSLSASLGVIYVDFMSLVDGLFVSDINYHRD